MTDLTVAIIKELLKKSDEDLRAELEAMLPKPDYPEHMFGLWAKHPKYGDVRVGYDHPDKFGEVFVSWLDESVINGTDCDLVPVSSLTFSEQPSKPEHPRTLSRVEDYKAAPVGTIVASPGNVPWVKGLDDEWLPPLWSGLRAVKSDIVEQGEQDVVRWGWG